MTQEVLKQMYRLLLTEPHAPTVCAQLERIAREALAEHAMQQRLGQEIEPDDIASILACREMLDAQPVPPRTWVGSGDIENSNAYLTPPQRTEQEPVALKWQRAPIRTAWGDAMVVASVAIDNDHTLSLYCERDQAPKVDAMFAQRTWVGLTGLDQKELMAMSARDAVFATEAKLKEKNT